MKHTSVMLDTPCEFINVVPLNPLVSKCQIKVCYVGDKPNRNKSIITKEVAREMANSLPGSPIVGCFNKQLNDFEEHSRDIHVSNGKLEVTDATRPYGFVDMNAKCWFQKFLDDGMDEREYLMTEGYLWTGQYPEAKRIIEIGNNQSMELNQDLLDATWTKNRNGKPQFFIINEAVIEKLCILGEASEPCFEGSTITRFSLDANFVTEMRSMMDELKQLLSKEKGGAQVFTKYSVKVGDSLWNALYAHTHENYSIAGVFVEEEQKFAVLQGKDNNLARLDFSYSEEDGIFTPVENVVNFEFALDGEPQFDAAEVENFEANFKKKEEDEKKDESEEGEKDKTGTSDSDKTTEDDSKDSDKEEKTSEEDKKEDKDDEDDKKKKKYSLEEIPEYVELASKFSDLESKYNTLVAEKAGLESQLQPLKEFKLNAERIAKEDMINKTFFMLSEDDKKDVIDNIDKYSLEDIEAKLSIICVRNKVSFAALEDDSEEQSAPTTYNLGENLFQDDSTPAWVKAVLDTAKTLN